MANQVETVQEQANNVVGFVSNTAHKALLVGLGAAAMAQDGLKDLVKSGEEFASKLVERGEEMAKNRREQLDTQVEKRQDQVKDLQKRVTGSFDKYTEQTLTRVHLPTSSDIESLSKEVSALSRKVDKIRKEQEKVAA